MNKYCILKFFHVCDSQLYHISFIEYERIRTYLSLIASNYPKIREPFLPDLKNVSSFLPVALPV